MNTSNSEKKFPVPVLHMITRLIVGGAQENTLFTAMLLDEKRYAVEILCGPQTGKEGSLIEEGRSKGVKIAVLPTLVRQLNPLQDILALIQMVRLLRKKRYSIVHTHSSKAGILGRVAAKIAGVPVIIHTVHGWSFHAHMPWLTRLVYILLERLCANFSDALIVVTDQDKQKGLQAGIGKPGQYHLIRSAIPLDQFDPARYDRQFIRRKLGIPFDALVVGTVGRFSAQKDPLRWVQVAEIIQQEINECYFLMVGDGPLRPQVELKLIEKGFKNHFILTGIQRDVPQMLSAMDVFLLTSLWEGLPRVIPQAMSMNLPVVATRVDGSVEIIEHGINGFLYPPEDIPGLASCCVNLLKNVKIRRAVSEKGRETALKNFDLNQMIAQIDALYEELLDKGYSSTG